MTHAVIDAGLKVLIIMSLEFGILFVVTFSAIIYFWLCLD